MRVSSRRLGRRRPHQAGGPPRSRSSPSILQLADIEVPGLPVETRANVLPAEEDVARRLHHSLAGDDPLAGVGVLALPDEPLQDGRLRLLELQEQRIVVVDPEEEGDPCAGADASDPDDLAGQVDEPELFQ